MKLPWTDTTMGFKRISLEEYNRYMELLRSYTLELYKYNSMIRDRGFYLKPKHVVVKNTREGKVKYIYLGRYWYTIKYIGKRAGVSRIKWIYVGKEKPDPSLPDPPIHPLEGVVIKVDKGGIYVKES